MYDGIQYRSRLEARWAAFFGLLGWRFEYEPIDMAGWIPDFLIHGFQHPVLVEVKPVTSFPGEVADKIEKAAKVSGWSTTSDEPRDNAHCELMIVGCSVPISSLMDSGSQIGWINDPLFGGANARWADASVAAEGKRYDLSSYQGWWNGRITGERYAGKSCFAGYGQANWLVTLWREAGNIVQWKGKRSKAT